MRRRDEEEKEKELRELRELIRRRRVRDEDDEERDIEDIRREFMRRRRIIVDEDEDEEQEEEEWDVEDEEEDEDKDQEEEDSRSFSNVLLNVCREIAKMYNTEIRDDIYFFVEDIEITEEEEMRLISIVKDNIKECADPLKHRDIIACLLEKAGIKRLLDSYLDRNSNNVLLLTRLIK